MKTKLQFISVDGKHFEDEYECAKYELETFPEMLEKLKESINSVHPPFQIRWCGSETTNLESFTSACACAGCANRAVYEVGMRGVHWRYWKDNIRKPNIADDENFNDVYEIRLVEINDNKIELIKFLRNQRENDKTPMELSLLLNQSYPVLITSSIYEKICELQKAIENIGVKTELTKNSYT